MSYYFIRVAGETGHNNPGVPEAYVQNEPPEYPKTYYNYYDYCLRNEFIRIGWPDVGDLKNGNRLGALSNFYSLESVKSHIRNYLLDFSHISLKSIVLMPNKDIPGDLYIGEVISSYEFYHDVPKAAYECAHRLGVKWDKGVNGKPRLYRASDLHIGIIGGWWLRAFHEITKQEIRDAIDKAREI